MDLLGLLKDEIKIEMENREREIFKLRTEIDIYRKVRDGLEKIIAKTKDQQSKSVWVFSYKENFWEKIWRKL